MAAATGQDGVGARMTRAAFSAVAGDGGMNPGDEAPPGTPGTGEAVCGVCNGTGRRGDAGCPNCGGTGKVTEGVGGG